MTGKKIPARQCVGCRESKPKKELIRIVRTEEGEIFLDPTGKRNGRGAYVCHCAECIERAMKTKGLDRSFKISVPEQVYFRLKADLENVDGQ